MSVVVADGTIPFAENLDRLERVKMVTKANNYQDMLNAIGRVRCRAAAGPSGAAAPSVFPVLQLT